MAHKRVIIRYEARCALCCKLKTYEGIMGHIGILLPPVDSCELQDILDAYFDEKFENTPWLGCSCHMPLIRMASLVAYNTSTFGISFHRFNVDDTFNNIKIPVTDIIQISGHSYKIRQAEVYVGPDQWIYGHGCFETFYKDNENNKWTKTVNGVVEEAQPDPRRICTLYYGVVDV